MINDRRYVFFSFLLNEVFVAATKSQRDYPPLYSRVKRKQVLIFFSAIGLIAPIKYIKQNIGDNIVKCRFYEISIKILRA